MTRAQHRLLLAIDAGPYHCGSGRPRQRALVNRLERMGYIRPSVRFGGWTLTSRGSHAIGTFDFA